MYTEQHIGKIILLVGKVACGKTTYARKMEIQNNAVLLSLDELQLDIFGASPSREQLDNSYLGCSEYQMRLAIKLVSMGIDVYLDWGFWSHSLRQEVRAKFEHLGLQVEQYYFDIPLAIRHERNNKRNISLDKQSFKIEPKDIAFFDRFFEEPQTEENDKIFIL